MKITMRFLVACMGACIFIGYSNALSIASSVAQPNEFPYEVSVLQNDKYLCSGTILDRKNILAPAHCVVCDVKKSKSDYKVLSGTNDHANKTAGQIHQVERVICHDDYDSASNDNDIAILRLVKPIIFSPAQNAVGLPVFGDVSDNAKVIAVGWGLLERKNQAPLEKLQKQETKTISNNDCKSLGGHSGSPQLICTHKTNGYNVCDADSGAALIYEGKIVGLATKTSCNGMSPNVYTRVYEYFDWISTVLSTKYNDW